MTCDTIPTWLKEFKEHEVAVQRRVGLKLLFEILSKLPRSDDVGELVRLCQNVIVAL